MLKSKWLDYTLQAIGIGMVLLLVFCLWDYFTHPDNLL